MFEPKLVKIPAGSYTLGVPGIISGLQHIWTGPRIVKTNAFLIGQTGVTVKEFTNFLLDTKGTVDGEFSSLGTQDGNLPAGEISWNDAAEYANWLRLKTGKPYRLPTADEWEVAARGGLSGKKYPWGDETPAGRCDYQQTKETVQQLPKLTKSFNCNGYGLYDMVGNLWCWCSDLWIDYVPNDPPVNTPTNKSAAINRVLRGGSFLTTDENCLMCAYIHEDPPDIRHACLGMRIACDI